MSDQPDFRVVPTGTSLVTVFKRFWHIVTVLLVAGMIFSYWWAFHAFSDQYYAPLQPIPYSHKLHAGELGIDCQYCHYNAARSKHAGVPPISICLGCHDPAQGAAAQDKPNVQKLLELVLEDGKVRSEYADSEDLDYQSDGSMKVGGNVHWNRIHKLPDHVYFRHEWHVEAGVSCQTCHGPIEEMEVVQQHAPLTMGWCIECHRDSNYVGGPEYDGTDETFSVGTANYDVLRARIQPDEVVSFIDRHTKGNHHGDDHGGDKGYGDKAGKDEDGHRDLRGIHSLSESIDDSLYNLHYFSKAQSDKLKSVIADNDAKGADALPRWRIPDLPSIHAEFYNTFKNEDGSPIDLDSMSKEEKNTWFKKHIRRFSSFQNAPTQCSTCHQ